MKIGIITQPLLTNYGGILQNYALQETLRRLGHDVTTIDQVGKSRTILSVFLSCIKLFIFKTLGKNREKPYPRIIKKEETDAISINTEVFINKYIKRTKKQRTYKDFHLATIHEDLDALIVGSDQVWRPKYNIDIAHSYFDFAENINVKKIAYAASFGVDDWEYSQKETNKCKRLVQKFNAISVREISAIKLCKDFFNIDATLVLDPTMLLNKEDYIKLVDDAQETKSNGDLFAYILDCSQQKQSIVKQVEKELKLTAFYTMPSKNINETKNDIQSCTFPKVTAWLRSFIDAKFVICDSFHGAVFSIIFNKPFIIIGNQRRGLTRFNSLIKMFDIEERLICNDDNLHAIIHKPVDWSKINAKRNELQSISLSFLKANL